MIKVKAYFLLVLAVCLVMLSACTADTVYPDAVRLHVVANSDEIEDQQVKLKVRDTILAECGDLIASSKDAEECFAQVETHKSDIADIAVAALRQNGFDYGAKALVGWYDFPTRRYEEATLPGGTYRTLRVELGEAAGKNWWCVIYPPMCISVKDDDDEIDALSSPDGAFDSIEGENGEDIVMKSFLFENLFGKKTPQPNEEAKSRLSEWLKSMKR